MCVCVFVYLYIYEIKFNDMKICKLNEHVFLPPKHVMFSKNKVVSVDLKLTEGCNDSFRFCRSHIS